MATTQQKIKDNIAAGAFHPAVAGVLRYFEYAHLPAGPLRDTSEEFAQLAYWCAVGLPSVPMLTTALNALLVAKDAAVRCALDIPHRGPAEVSLPSTEADDAHTT